MAGHPVSPWQHAPVSRRTAVQAGAIGLLGLGTNHLEALRAADPESQATPATAKTCIYIFLSGGLSPNNVAEAVLRVCPYAVDVCSGVESEPGLKDLQAVERADWPSGSARRRKRRGWLRFFALFIPIRQMILLPI